MAEPEGAPHAMLLDDESDSSSSQWDVASDGQGSYTLRNVKTGLYLGSEKHSTTSIAPTLEGVSKPFAWKLEPGSEPETFTLSPRDSNGATRLDLSILRIFPPPIGWMPPGSPTQLWRLVRV